MSLYDLASELQTYFRSSLLSLGKEEGGKRRPEVRRGSSQAKGSSVIDFASERLLPELIIKS